MFSIRNEDLITLQQGSGSVLMSTGTDNSICTGGSTNPDGTQPADFDVSNSITVDLNSDIVDTVNDITDLTDVFGFTGTSEIYTFVLSDFGTADLNLYIVDSLGNALISSIGTAGTESITITLIEGVTYHLIVTAEDTGGATQGYLITTTREQRNRQLRVLIAAVR